MTTRRIIFLTETLPWLLIKDEAIVARGEQYIAENASEEETLIIVPRADCVALIWADLPGLAPAQALGAARLVAAEQSLIAAGDLFVACGDEQGETGARVIASASRSDVAHWVNCYDPDLIIPAPLLIAAPDTGFARAHLGHETIVRSKRFGFGEDDIVSPMIIRDAPVTTFDRADIEAAVIAATLTPEVNLRSGEFARKRAWNLDRGWLRWMGIVFAALVAVSLTIPLVQIARLSWDARLLGETSASLAQTALGEAVVSDDAVSQLDARLTALRGGGAGFIATQTAVSRAIESTGNTELSAMQFSPDGVLKVTVRAAGVAEIDAVQSKLRALGLTVTAGPVNPSQGQPLVELQVRGR